MRINKRKNYAVLTGDIVGSTKLARDQRRRLQRCLQKAGDLTQEVFADVCPVRMAAFRGDGWQLLLTAPDQAVHVAVFLRASLRMLMDRDQLDTKTSIGIGKIEFVPTDRLGEGDGPAFQLSGRGLKGLNQRKRFCLQFPPHVPASTMLTATLNMLDACIQRWTPSQCQAVVGTMQQSTQETIASGWTPSPITQQAVGKHLERAFWPAIQETMQTIQTHVQQQLNKQSVQTRQDPQYNLQGL